MVERWSRTRSFAYRLALSRSSCSLRPSLPPSRDPPASRCIGSTIMGDIVIYYSSVSSTTKVKKDLQYAMCLLDAKNVSYKRVDVSLDARVREKMQKASGKKALPQIFIDDKFIGVRARACARESECESLCARVSVSMRRCRLGSPRRYRDRRRDRGIIIAANSATHIYCCDAMSLRGSRCRPTMRSSRWRRRASSRRS